MSAVNPALRRLIVAAASATLFCLVQYDGASAVEHVDDQRPPTLSGSFLAARSADLAYDLSAAIAYYDRVRQYDPANQGLIERTLLLTLADGDMALAKDLSDDLLKLDPANPAAGMAMAVQAIKAKDFPAAIEALDKMEPGELANAGAGLLKAWVQFEQGDIDTALATIAALKGPDWYVIFTTFHTAIMLDAAGRESEAVAAIKKLYKPNSPEQEIVLGYARIMARAGEKAEAMRALTAYAGEDPTNPAALDLLTMLRAGKTPPPLANDAATGGAETLYGLGAAIGLGKEPALSLAYFRMAAFLDPTLKTNTMAIGATLQAIGRFEDAVKVFQTIPPDSSWGQRAGIEIGTCHIAMEKTDEAIADFKKVAEDNPDDTEALIALGDAYRTDENWQGAVDAYSKALALKQAQGVKDWRLKYFRGIGYERLGQWPQAESDFKGAIAIDDQQPQVLNYLGYMWVDRGVHLDEGLKLLKDAVAHAPDAGYIVDSLGWAEYRLGRYADAVKTLERAVALSSDDPTMNDHLGDAYWQVGRTREAHYQWAHARDFDPDPDLKAKIEEKLANGLDGGKPTTVKVGPGESLWDIATRVFGDGNQYLRIYEANRDRLRDPNSVETGQELTIPASN